MVFPVNAVKDWELHEEVVELTDRLNKLEKQMESNDESETQ